MLPLPIRYDRKTKPSAETASNAVMISRLPCCLIRGFIFLQRVATRVLGEIPITKPVIAREENRLLCVILLSFLKWALIMIMQGTRLLASINSACRFRRKNRAPI